MKAFVARNICIHDLICDDTSLLIIHCKLYIYQMFWLLSSSAILKRVAYQEYTMMANFKSPSAMSKGVASIDSK